MKIFNVLGSASVIAAMVALGGMTPAVAATEQAPNQSCWHNTDTDRTVCFDASVDPTDYIEQATGRQLVFLEPGTTPADVAENGRSVLATYALAQFWDLEGKTGASYTATASWAPCTGTNTWSIGSGLGALGWNDRIESFQSYGTCRSKLWENSDSTGATYGYAVSANSLGVMRNHASRIQVQN